MFALRHSVAELSCSPRTSWVGKHKLIIKKACKRNQYFEVWSRIFKLKFSRDSEAELWSTFDTAFQSIRKYASLASDNYIKIPRRYIITYLYLFKINATSSDHRVSLLRHLQENLNHSHNLMWARRVVQGKVFDVKKKVISAKTSENMIVKRAYKTQKCLWCTIWKK